MNTVDKRGTMRALPEEIRRMLTPDQAITLSQLEKVGWRIAFVRRPMLHKTVVVLINHHDKEFGVLEPNGELNRRPNIMIRECIPVSQTPSATASINNAAAAN